jgi:hypothetical protein
VLAVSRYGLKACEIAALLRKDRNSVTRWLNQGLRREHDDPEFVARLDSLDSAISGDDNGAMVNVAPLAPATTQTVVYVVHAVLHEDAIVPRHILFLPPSPTLLPQ